MIEITITRKLDETFGKQKELDKLSDEEVVELVFDNFEKFLNNADWKVSRVVEEIV